MSRVNPVVTILLRSSLTDHAIACAGATPVGGAVMRTIRPKLLTSCAVALSALLATGAAAATVDGGGAGPAPVAAQPVAAPAVVQASASQVVLATSVVDSAAAFAGYMDRAGSIKPDYV